MTRHDSTAAHRLQVVCTDDPVWRSIGGFGCGRYSSSGDSHAFCNSDSDLGIDERLPSEACPVACESCFRACSSCITSGQPVISGSFSYTFTEPGDYYLRSTSSSTMRVDVHVVDCQFCHVFSGYDGDNAISLAVAVSSRTPGDYSFSFVNFAAIGENSVCVLPVRFLWDSNAEH